MMAAYVNIFPPDHIAYIVTFYVLLWITFAIFILYLSGNIRRAALCATGAVIYLILRSFGLRHPLYGILLVSSIIAIEILMRDR